jgi:hypothetical protein
LENIILNLNFSIVSIFIIALEIASRKEFFKLCVQFSAKSKYKMVSTVEKNIEFPSLSLICFVCPNVEIIGNNNKINKYILIVINNLSK